MSTTLEGERVSALLDDAPCLSAPGRTHPVAIHHAEPTPTDPIDAVPAAVHRALGTDRGDILVFLPGVAAIHRVASRFDSLEGTEVLPLHGSLALAKQAHALAPAASIGDRPRRRILLATDLAESSLTIEGIEVVIDTGLTLAGTPKLGRSKRRGLGSGRTG
jgi:ATP-dependent helicase HrpB